MTAGLFSSAGWLLAATGSLALEATAAPPATEPTAQAAEPATASATPPPSVEAHSPETNATTAHPAAQAHDASDATLFDPVPHELMRPLVTDRPDMTEAPITVDAGHVQIEADLVVATFRDAGDTPVTLDILPTNIKVGLLPSVDLQILVPALGVAFDRNANATSSAGDAGARLKWNLFGNDGEGPAMAVMPWFYVAGADLRAGGGLIVPVSFPLPADFALGTMAVINYVPLEDGTHAAELAASASIGRDIVGDLAGYLEVFGSGQPRPSEGEFILSTGLTYGASDDVQLDAGARVPLLTPDPRVESFLGVSVRH